jgi:hypothetical protein
MIFTRLLYAVAGLITVIVGIGLCFFARRVHKSFLERVESSPFWWERQTVESAKHPLNRYIIMLAGCILLFLGICMVSEGVFSYDLLNNLRS